MCRGNILKSGLLDLFLRRHQELEVWARRRGESEARPLQEAEEQAGLRQRLRRARGSGSTLMGWGGSIRRRNRTMVANRLSPSTRRSIGAGGKSCGIRNRIGAAVRRRGLR